MTEAVSSHGVASTASCSAGAQTAQLSRERGPRRLATYGPLGWDVHEVTERMAYTRTVRWRTSIGRPPPPAISTLAYMEATMATMSTNLRPARREWRESSQAWKAAEEAVRKHWAARTVGDETK